MIRPHTRERLPNATAAYLEAYVALELSAERAQGLVDRLRTIVGALSDTGTHLRIDAWKFTGISELPAVRSLASEPGQPIRLTKMPTAEQLLEAIAEWRKKRNHLQYLWDNLPDEVRMILKVPETLD